MSSPGDRTGSATRGSRRRLPDDSGQVRWRRWAGSEPNADVGVRRQIANVNLEAGVTLSLVASKVGADTPVPGWGRGGLGCERVSRCEKKENWLFRLVRHAWSGLLNQLAPTILSCPLQRPHFRSGWFAIS